MTFGMLNINKQIYVFFITLVCLACAFWAPLELSRVTVVVGFILLFIIDLKQARNTTMISAVFLLGVFSVSLFSIVPAVFYLLTDLLSSIYNFHWEEVDLPWIPSRVPAYVGSNAERLVLIFGGFLILGHFMTRFIQEREISDSPPPFAHMPLLYLFAASAAITTTLLMLHFMASGSQIMGMARAIFYPVQGLLLLISLRHCLDKKAYRIVGFCNFLYFISASVLISESRIAVFFIISVFLFLSYKRFFSFYSLIRIGLISVIIILIVVLSIQFVRYPQEVASYEKPSTSAEKSTISWSWVAGKIYWKVIYRQIETGACLKSVVEQHWGEKMVLRDQFFWLEALVPRIVWPEKPNLSLGHSYSYRYCGIPKANNGHSSAITLLGEPIIKGGALGLYVHGGILVIGLMIFSAFARRNGDAGAILCLSMLPWWINFEQHFGLYVANLVKFGMIILVTYIAILFIERYFVRRLDDANS